MSDRGLRGALGNVFDAVGSVAGMVAMTGAAGEKLAGAGYWSADGLEKTTRLESAMTLARKLSEAKEELDKLGISLEELGLEDRSTEDD